MDRKLQNAKTSIEELSKKYPTLKITEEPLYQGMTNRVYFGTYEDQPVAIKYFSDIKRRQQEARALKLLKKTGVTTTYIPIEDEHLLLTKRFAGNPLAFVQEELSENHLQDIYEGMGAALASIEKWSEKPGEDHDWRSFDVNNLDDLDNYRHSSWADFVDCVVRMSRKALSDNQITDSDLHESIEQIAENAALVNQYETFFMGSDFGQNNMIVHKNKFKGFVDFETSRYGNIVYLLGTGMFMIWKQHPQHIQSLLKGYFQEAEKQETEELLRLSRIYAPLSFWTVFANYFNMKELPQWAIDLKQKDKILNYLKITIRSAKDDLFFKI